MVLAVSLLPPCGPMARDIVADHAVAENVTTENIVTGKVAAEHFAAGNETVNNSVLQALAAGTTMTAEEWAQLAQRAVCQHYREQDTTALSLRVLSTPDWTALPTDASIRVEMGHSSAGRIPVDMNVTDAQGGVRHRTVWLQSAVVRNAWVITRDVPAKTRIDDKLVKQQRIAIAGTPEDMSRLEPDPHGKLTRTAIRNASPLFTDMLIDKPIVERASDVSVIVQDKYVTIRTRGIAQADGFAVGDWIAVRVRGADEPVMARVAAPGEVHVAN